MDLPSHVPVEKLEQHHYLLIKESFIRYIDKLKASKAKLLYNLLDIDVIMRNLYQFDNVWIVGGYLVVYEIAPSWCSDEPMIHECLVYRLAPGYTFDIVPQFLEQRGREAGCKYAVVGTALAKSDSALASLYSRSGFAVSHLHMMKEL